MKSIKALLTNKTVFQLGFQTNNRLKYRINQLFGFDSKSTIQNSFQTFSKTPKYKTIGCFDKTTGCFSLSLKNTLILKDLKTLKLQIHKEWITNIIYPRSYSKAPQQQQAHLAFHQTQMIWILQSLNTLDLTMYTLLLLSYISFLY